MDARNKHRLCLLIFLVVILDLTSGWIEFCPDGENLVTVQGHVGGSVNISFCLRSRPELDEYIYIIDSDCGNKWCRHNTSLYRGSLITTKITVSYYYEYQILVQRSPIIQEDFGRDFLIRFQTSPTDTFTVTYNIQQNEAAPTTPNVVWPPTTSAASYTSTSATTENCPTIGAYKCPSNWLTVGNNKCLMVTNDRLDISSAAKKCQEFKSELLNPDHDADLFQCIGDLLSNSMKKRIWLKKCSEDYYRKNHVYYCFLDLKTKREARANLTGNYFVACLINLDNPNPDIDMPTTFTTSALTTSSAITTIAAAISTATTTTECPILESSKCPSNLYPVTGNKCLWVSNETMYYTSAVTYCQNLKGYLPNVNEDATILACISDKVTGRRTDVWLQGTCGRYSYCSYNTYTKDKSTVYWESYSYSVVCLIHEDNVEPPSIVKFQAVINTTKRQDLLLLPKDWLNVYSDLSVGDLLNFSCESRGQPTPTVFIHSMPRFSPFGRAVQTCGFLGNFSCKASNIFGESAQTESYQIVAKCPYRIDKFHLSPSQTNKGRKVTLTCTVEGYPKLVVRFIRVDTGQELKKSLSDSLQVIEYLTFDLENATCDDIGTYMCQADRHNGSNLQSNTAELQIYNCPVQMCKNETTTRDITLSVNQSTTLSLCLRSFPQTIDTTVFHENKLIPRVSNKCQVKNTKITEIYHNMDIKLNNIQESDIGQWVFQMKNYYGTVNLTINLQAQESDSKGQTGNMGGHGDFNILHIVIPVVIIIVIAAVIAGLVIYRKRGARNNTLSRALLPGQESAVTYEDKGSVYANVDTHVYGNVSSAEVMRSRPQEQETRIDEADLNIPTDQETSEPDSGRYVSETGLVYITVQQASGNAKPQMKMKKPKRAKQVLQEQVEYMSVDYEKSGKMPVSEDDNMNESSNKDEAEDLANSDQTSEGDSSH